MIKNIKRSRENKWLAGIAGGLAKRYGLSVLLVRLLFVVATLFLHMIAVLLYLILWLLIPLAPEDTVVEVESESTTTTTTNDA